MTKYVLLTYTDLHEKKGIPFSRVHLWRLIRAGSFPQPIKLSESRHAWIESEIDAWIAKRAAERD